jgi:hypothetical protein
MENSQKKKKKILETSSDPKDVDISSNAQMKLKSMTSKGKT